VGRRERDTNPLKKKRTIRTERRRRTCYSFSAHFISSFASAFIFYSIHFRMGAATKKKEKKLS
jgi:hypothetical protein